MGKMQCGHLLFTGIIVIGVPMSCNFDREDGFSSKLNARLSRMPARAILIEPCDHLIGRIVALAVRFEDGGVLLSLIIGRRSPLCSPDMSWRHLSSLASFSVQKFLTV